MYKLELFSTYEQDYPQIEAVCFLVCDNTLYETKLDGCHCTITYDPDEGTGSILEDMARQLLTILEAYPHIMVKLNGIVIK